MARHLAALFAALLVTSAGFGRDAQQSVPKVSLGDLPPEVRQTLALIKRGGPFPYKKDGTLFRNFEVRLPAREREYYREFTVPTPGVRGRGARRIVAGRGAAGDAASSDEYYYTDDHYQSFRRIRE
jgi:ribonuclease T1